MTDLTAWAESFQRFAVAAEPISPLYTVLARAVAADPALLALAALVPLENQPANILMAAVQRRLFELPDDPLARFYANLTAAALPPEQAVADFRRFVLAQAAALTPLLTGRRTSTNELQRAAVLLPAFGLAAAEAEPLHLVEIGCSAGILLAFDRVAYDYGDAGRLGPADAPLTLRCQVEGKPPLPLRLPRVASRVGLDLMPLDAGNADDVAWLEALVWPEQPARRERLRQALTLTRATPPRLIAGDAAESFAAVAASLPADGLVVVFHSFALVQFPAAARARLLAAIDDLALRRPVWRIGYEHAFAAHAALDLQRHGVDSAPLRLAAAAPHGDWLRWVAAPGA